MKWYPWLRPSFEQLVGSYQAGRGHHALLLQSLNGMGGEALIYALCRFLMCRQPEGHKSCGHCHSCQLMQAGTHPDYYALSPEKGKSALGIDAVRDVNEKLYEHARLGGAKVVWISDAALLTDAAANALLKTLEEPPENTWFFLACEEPARLLTTLRSRCRLHHLAPPSEPYALAWLEREVSLPQESLLTALPARRLRRSNGYRNRCGRRGSSCVRRWRLPWRAVTGWRCCRYSIMNRRRFACTGWRRCWSMRKNDSRGLPW